MRIAIVGAGVSGLVAAHLLAPRARGHRVRGGRLRRRAHQHRPRRHRATQTHHVDTGFIVFNDRNYPNFERLLARLRRRRRSRRTMSFGGQRRARRLRVQRRLAQRPVRQARAPGHAVVPPDGRRPRALQPRGARRCSRGDGDGPSLGEWLDEQRFSRAVRRAADRARRPSAVWSADPRADVELPGALPGRVLRQPRDARLPRPAALADGRRRLARATSRRSSRRWRDRLRLRTPVAAIRAPRRPRRGHAARRRARALRRGRVATHSDQALAHARRRHRRASTSCSARSPTSPTRRCCTPTRALLPRRRRAWAAGTTTCSTSRPARTHGDLPHEPPAVAARRPRVLRDAQPHARRSTRRR